MKAIIIQTTCSDKNQAKKLAKVLLEKRLAACLQLSNIESFYKWEGEFCNDNEVLLSIKTKKKNFEKIESIIKELHSYDVPEIIAIDVNNISKDYKKFISKSC
ncbi:divalent-cation tolerance protein CutA [Halarcobacter sp.]|uniref:divalent-cation tolerance protein CutA n=1 Tax=Halarcobacter sp. TaxID=2321133 RepID=UPI002AAB6B8C|nr:divalent-cation tolerance protein CutA [Halarcobacter sp.]